MVHVPLMQAVAGGLDSATAALLDSLKTTEHGLINQTFGPLLGYIIWNLTSSWFTLLGPVRQYLQAHLQWLGPVIAAVSAAIMTFLLHWNPLVAAHVNPILAFIFGWAGLIGFNSAAKNLLQNFKVAAFAAPPTIPPPAPQPKMSGGN